jgi:predicted CXXCH cytochrome family protein
VPCFYSPMRSTRPSTSAGKWLKGSLAFLCLALGVAGAQVQPAPITTNAGYVEPSACTSCHQEIAASYARTAMARTFGVVRSAAEIPALKGGKFEHIASGEFFSVVTRDNQLWLKRWETGFDGAVINVLEARVDYWFGSGNHARSYISRAQAGELIELPLTWYAERNGYWAMSPGYDRPDHAGFSRKLSYRCMACHNGYIAAPESAPGLTDEASTRFPEKLPAGIDCQRCHGPGQAHVEAARQGQPPERVRHTIVNPARLAPDRQAEVCLQCHLETTSLKLPATLLRAGRGVFSYRPGEPLADYILHFDRSSIDSSSDRFEFASAAYRLRQSACFVKSPNQLNCTICHNPHEPANTPAAMQRYTTACLNCHQPALQKQIAARRHTTEQNCATCHMPKRAPSDAIHTQVTDHRIQARPALPSTDKLVEQHDGNTPPYRGRVALYYPAQLAQTPERELYLALAQVKHDANVAQGLRELEDAIARHQPAQPQFYFELAEAYRRTGRLPQAIAFYEQACARKPVNWRHFHQLGTALTAANQPERAAQALARAQSLAPREPAILEASANLLARQGNLPAAIAALHAALALDPTAATLHSNLGARMLQSGDAKAAEQAWREAVRLRPEAATARLNLANLLANTDNFAEAQTHFLAAIRAAPSFADAYLAYAIALAAHGEHAQAERHLQTTLNLAPNSYEAHLRLGQLLHTRGEAARAEAHLRQVIASPDQRLREAAQQLLQAIRK